jgi:hypothetical protein
MKQQIKTISRNLLPRLPVIGGKDIFTEETKGFSRFNPPTEIRR